MYIGMYILAPTRRAGEGSVNLIHKTSILSSAVVLDVA
jgi:hypothetical protein